LLPLDVIFRLRPFDAVGFATSVHGGSGAETSQTPPEHSLAVFGAPIVIAVLTLAGLLAALLLGETGRIYRGYSLHRR